MFYRSESGSLRDSELYCLESWFVLAGCFSVSLQVCCSGSWCQFHQKQMEPEGHRWSFSAITTSAKSSFLSKPPYTGKVIPAFFMFFQKDKRNLNTKVSHLKTGLQFSAINWLLATSPLSSVRWCWKTISSALKLLTYQKAGLCAKTLFM